MTEIVRNSAVSLQCICELRQLHRRYWAIRKEVPELCAVVCSVAWIFNGWIKYCPLAGADNLHPTPDARIALAIYRA